ncbi:MAG TPA: zinc finger domain-containing protein, partial [Jatrophihabitans sp.]|nr:zinc finger domain-containing protein [Jatrophihabitans sp.]
LTKVVTTAQRLLRANRDHPEQTTTGYLERGRQHWVYGRAGEGCLRCRTPIERELQGDPPQQRSTYWCPRCQPAPS